MMIFKRWFKPKWQHQDPTVRVNAIASLDHGDQTQKEVLHELAFNDGAEQVRRAALERLNEFSLWWQASKHESAERLKQFAEQQLVDMLLQNRVSASLKQTFITECHRSSILEKLAQHDPDITTRYSLLLRLERQDLYLAALANSDFSDTQRLELIARIDDDKALERLVKQLQEPLKSAVQAELNDRQLQREKPEKVKKQLVLLLAKLNAVRERTDVLDAWQTWQDLLAQWQQLSVDLPCLTDASDFVAKFERIEQLTEQSLLPRVQQAQQQQAAVQQAAADQATAAAFANDVAALNQRVAAHVAAGELDVAADQQSALESLTRQVLHAQLPEALVQPLVKQLAKLQHHIDSIPQLSEQLAQMARMLADLTAQPLPALEQVDTAWQAFERWQKEWNNAVKQLAISVPEQFAVSHAELVERWQQHCEPMRAGQQKQLKLLKNKLQEFKRLHQEGRYNPLFGLLKGIEQQVASMGPLSPAVQKELDGARELLQQLTELQAYIATPRKQELLAEIQALSQQAVTAVHERAQQVKQARQVWNSLGRADDSLEAQLNDAFNQACEQAFAPCRDFYAEQDAQRAQAAARKTALLEQMASYAFADVKDVEKQLQSWQQEWEQAGVTERDVHQQLLDKYRAVTQAARNYIKQHHVHNAQRKAEMIASAQQAVESGSPDIARQLKQLQQLWKTVGYAGKKAEQDLWQQFRAVCDDYFAKRDAEKQQQQQQVQELLQQQQVLLAQITADDASSVEQRLAQLSDERWHDDLVGAVKTLQQQLRNTATTQRQDEQRAELDQLLSLLALPDLQAAQLPPVYRLVFGAGQEHLLSRAELTVALEIAAGLESPTADSSIRQQVQMALLSQKLNDGEDVGVAALFSRWLQYGSLGEAELPLLTRVAQVLRQVNAN